jgi:DMSO/TMAO reductase YedYZ molybdopterin-dependent catalytic subunit
MTMRAYWTRRYAVQSLVSLPFAVAASAQEGDAVFTVPGKRPMILHNEFPEDLESLPEYLATWITPIDSFFVRQHLPRPKIDRAAFRLEVGGMVNNKSSLSIEDLKKLPQSNVPATLECAGNGRGNFRPRMPGLQWTKGAIGNAEWRGPRLKDVLARAGASSNAAFADFNGADVGVGKTPDFIRSIPMRKLTHEATILALEMNGQPLPEIHGGPVRLIVPGWDGASWVKWLNSIELTEQMHGGFYMNPAYRYPRRPVAPGQPAKPEEMDVLEGMAVKSFFAKPAAGIAVKLGSSVLLTGAAWAGEERVTRVEVSTDGGMQWRDATLSRQNFPFAWRIWTFEWKPPQPGYQTLCCRATDSGNRTQPIDAVWNPPGYLNNSIERLGVIVEA